MIVIDLETRKASQSKGTTPGTLVAAPGLSG